MDSSDKVRAAIRAGLAAKGTDATALSKRIGRGKDYLRDFLTNKKNSIKPVELAAIEKILDIKLSIGDNFGNDLKLTSYNNNTPAFNSNNKLPIYAAAEGGAGTLIISTEAIDWLPRPSTLESINDGYGILISGHSMEPAYRPGDTAWVNPRLPPMKDEDVVLYSGHQGDDRHATIKRLAAYSEKEWTLEQFNPPKRFKLSRAEWPICHRVIGKFNRR